MNADLLSEIRTKYRSFLYTAEGREQLTRAVAVKREWLEDKANSDIATTTSGVKLKSIDRPLAAKITKIEITPIGLNNMCHYTSELLCDDAKGITKRLGFNITACPCSKLMIYEIHSVNKYGGQLYDFTKDFNDETKKYFLEMDTDMSGPLYISLHGSTPKIINKGCRCGRRHWKNMLPFIVPETELITHIQSIESLVVAETPFGGIMLRQK